MMIAASRTAAAAPIRRLGGAGGRAAIRRPSTTAADAPAGLLARLPPLPPALASLAAKLPRLPPLNRNFALGLGGGLLMAGLHSATGSANDFYEYRFISPKDPDDLASFFGGEELMELYCVLPFMGQLMMRYSVFDDVGNVMAYGLPGTLKVSMVFSSEENENTGATDWFNKRERFQDTFMGFTCWDMVVNFGFRTLEDGRRECYHAGEYFHGNLPIVSQLVLLVFKIHARWVVWAVEHHINHFAFTGSLDLEDEEDEEYYEKLEHDSRLNMPFFLLRNYALSDIWSMITGSYDREKQPSFLLDYSNTTQMADDYYEKYLSKDAQEARKLPFQKKSVQIQIAQDIEDDRQTMKQILAEQRGEPEDVKDMLARRSTLARRATAARKLGKSDADLEEKDVAMKRRSTYVMAKDLALERGQVRRVTKRRTTRAFKAVQNAETIADE